MRKGYFICVSFLCLAAAASARPSGVDSPRHMLLPSETSRRAALRVSPRAAEALNETVFFGGTTWAPDSMRWEAIPDSVWTFDTGVGSAIKEPGHSYPDVDPYKEDGLHATMEGWTGLDFTAPGNTPQYFRRLSDTDPRWLPGTVCVGLPAGLGDHYSFWAGVFPAEAADLCYADGQGYGNGWNICLAHSFAHTSGSVTLEYDYRIDMEEGFDFARVKVEKNGTVIEVAAHTGVDSGHQTVALGSSELPAGSGTVTITFCVTSDTAWSDEDGFYPSTYGAFALDNVTLSGGITYTTDFETDDGGWTLLPSVPGAGGEWSNLVDLNDLPAIPGGVLGNCTLADSVLVLFDPDTESHPLEQTNVAVSPWIDLLAAGATGYPGKTIFLDGYFDLPLQNYVVVLDRVQYYPYECPFSGKVGISPWMTGFQWYSDQGATCVEGTESREFPLDGVLPDSAEQVRIAIGVANYCRFYSNCSGTNNSSPWFDNVRFAVHTLTQGTLQSMVDAAGEGETVMVPPGTYTGPGNWDLDFGSKNLVFLAAAGPESTFIECSGDTVGHRGFVFIQGDHSASVVQGFTIRHGVADKAGDNEGGGIWVDCISGPTIRDCVLDSCEAQSGGGVGVASPGVIIESCRFQNNTCSGYGGGLLGAQLIRGCVFEGNSASEGGGAHTEGRVENSSFVENNAQIGGGLNGIFTEIYDSEFVDNFAGGHIIRGHGGGIYGAKRVERCTLTGNTARYGAGIFTGGSIYGTTKLYIDCTLQNNGGGLNGGGAVLIGDVRLSGGVIQGNASQEGGGVYAAEGSTGLYPEIENALITGNAATYGGGVSIGDNRDQDGTEYVYLTGCTISGNRADTGGGVYVDVGSRGVSERSIVWGNCSSGSGPDVCVAESTSTMEFTCSSVDTADIEGLGTIVLNGPQVMTNPLFCGPGTCEMAPSLLGNYTLAGASPCLPANNPCGVLIGARDQGCATTGVGDEPGGPRPPVLAAYPNPFFGNLHLSFSGPADASAARVEIFDVRGRLVWRRDVPVAAGDLDWNGLDVTGHRAAPGVYFVHFRSGGVTKAARVVRLR